jgi:predicted nucleotidyltransferase
MDLSASDDLAWLAGLVADLRAAAPDHEPLMVGAMARDLLLHYGEGVAVARATIDVDLAFAVAHWEQFAMLRHALVDSGRFSPYPAVAHRLFHLGKLAIDLIPFGGVEDATGRIRWPGDDSLMRVLGYREAAATAIEVRLPRGEHVRTVSLPMLAVLKVVAWAERHATSPRKDARDLFLALRHHLSSERAERLFSDAPQLLETDDFDLDVAGAWLAGRDAARAILAASEQPRRLLDAVEGVLARETDADGRLELVGESGIDAEFALRLLTGLRNGLAGVGIAP